MTISLLQQSPDGCQSRPRPRSRASRAQVLTVGLLTLLGALATSLWATQATAAAQDEPLAGPRVDVSCEDRNGRFDFTLPNNGDNVIDYALSVLDDDRSGMIEPETSATETFLGLADGPYSITVFYNDTPLGPLEVTVTCDQGLPHDFNLEASCLANRGRVDITITNAADVPTVFQIDVGGVMKELTLDADATGISTTTGRPNGTIPITVNAPLWEGTASVSINCDPVQTASITGFCAGSFGQLTVQLFNPSASALTYTVELTDQEPKTVTVGPNENATASFGALPDGEYVARISTPGLPLRTFPLRGLYCEGTQPEIGVAVTSGCLGTRGRIDAWVRNGGAEAVTGTVDITGLATRNVTVEPNQPRTATTATGRLDGTYVVDVSVGGTTVSSTVEIDCDDTPNPVAPAASASCLAGRGRVDIVLPNTGDAPIEFRVEFPGLAPRSRTVAPPATSTVTVTGRLDGNYAIAVFADDVLVDTLDVTVACAGEQV